MSWVKICGLTDPEDAKWAYELGARALGFVFYEASPRFVDDSRARRCIEALPEDALTIGVFVNGGVNHIESKVRNLGLKGVQLHGDESPAFCSRLKKLLPEDTRVFKAFRLISEHQLSCLKEYHDCDGFVLDSARKGVYGGSGVLSDWEKASRAAKTWPVILAGGLNPDNVATAFEKVKPLGVDVSSGVEQKRGKKSPELLEMFLQKVKAG